MIIYQADIYDIPIRITINQNIITPQDVSDVIIAIGNMVRSFSNGDLYFDGENWIFPLSDETKKMSGVYQGQAEIIIGKDKLHTPTFGVKFAPSVNAFINGGDK